MIRGQGSGWNRPFGMNAHKRWGATDSRATAAANQSLDPADFKPLPHLDFYRKTTHMRGLHLGKHVPMTDTPALEITDLRKTYANGTVALKGVSLTVQQGDFFALLGPNGAGKSTLIGILSSLVNASGGSAKIFGVSIHEQRSKAMHLIGMVPQEINFNQFEKPFDICVNQAGFYGIPRAEAMRRAEKYLKELRLWDKAEQPARSLSGGMKRRLMIARAMMNEPKLLILDEPTAGVDIEIRRSMWHFVRGINAAGTTVILTTHYLEEAEQLCRNIAIIDHGSIVEDTSMKNLLSKLDVETFILDTSELPNDLPDVNGITVKRADAHTLEAEMARGHDLNSLFAMLDKRGITVTSMRNKANRLEELFVRLVEKNDDGKENAA
jgi:ABC-2 type transport system ATP-binding protein